MLSMGLLYSVFGEGESFNRDNIMQHEEKALGWISEALLESLALQIPRYWTAEETWFSWPLPLLKNTYDCPPGATVRFTESEN